MPNVTRYGNRDGGWVIAMRAGRLPMAHYAYLGGNIFPLEEKITRFLENCVFGDESGKFFNAFLELPGMKPVYPFLIHEEVRNNKERNRF